MNSISHMDQFGCYQELKELTIDRVMLNFTVFGRTKEAQICKEIGIQNINETIIGTKKPSRNYVKKFKSGQLNSRRVLIKSYAGIK